MRSRFSWSWFVVLAALFMAANGGAQAHNGVKHDAARASVAAAAPDFTIVLAAALTAPREADRRDDPGCAHGPLHVFCVAGAACCVASGDQGLMPAPGRQVTGTWRHAPVAGLAPPPLDRPPR
jgi:hypothetical protein